MDEPLVSVITTTYNHRDYVEQCLSSVREQTYSNWEHIVIDDASTDGTSRVSAGFTRGDDRVRLIDHQYRVGAGGIVESFNEALRSSTGDLIAILGGDDWWEPDRLASQVPLMAGDPSVVLCYGDCWEVLENGRRIGRVASPVSRDSVRTSPAAAVRYFARLTTFPALTVIVRRDALDRIGGFRSHGRLMDFTTWLELSLAGDFIRIPRTVASWRRHQASALWQFMDDLSREAHQAFTAFVARNVDAIRRLEVDPSDLVVTADRMLDRKLRSIPYLDAQYELLCGRRLQACRKFAKVASKWDTPMSLRASALVGMASSATSRRLFSAALGAKRRLQFR